LSRPYDFLLLSGEAGHKDEKDGGEKKRISHLANQWLTWGPSKTSSSFHSLAQVNHWMAVIEILFPSLNRHRSRLYDGN